MNNKQKTYKLVLAAVFTALIIVMSFTPLGYLRVGFVSISFMTIPVALGAVLLGPAYGAYFGLLFGITSFIQCFTGDLFGAMLVGKIKNYVRLFHIVTSRSSVFELRE